VCAGQLYRGKGCSVEEGDSGLPTRPLIGVVDPLNGTPTLRRILTGRSLARLRGAFRSAILIPPLRTMAWPMRPGALAQTANGCCRPSKMPLDRLRLARSRSIASWQQAAVAVSRKIRRGAASIWQRGMATWQLGGTPKTGSAAAWQLVALRVALALVAETSRRNP